MVPLHSLLPYCLLSSFNYPLSPKHPLLIPPRPCQFGSQQHLASCTLPVLSISTQHSVTLLQNVFAYRALHFSFKDVVSHAMGPIPHAGHQCDGNCLCMSPKGCRVFKRPRSPPVIRTSRWFQVQSCINISEKVNATI